jgi:hypothetical protein
MVRYNLQKGVSDRTILYKDNKDHFSCIGGNNVDDIRLKPSVDSKNECMDIFILAHYRGDMRVAIPNPERRRLWVMLSASSDPSERLSFHHRIRAKQQFLLEIDPAQIACNAEKGAVHIMKAVRRLSLPIRNVYSYGVEIKGNRENLATSVANVVAMAMSATFRVFPLKPVVSSPEIQRLNKL